MKFCNAKLCSVLLSVFACASLAIAQEKAKDVSGSDSLRTQLRAISAGGNNAARRTAITKRLDELGIKYRLDKFSEGGLSGTNIVAELKPTGQKVLMLGAHYDRVEQGKGAIDNASGSTAVLELLAALSANPTKESFSLCRLLRPGGRGPGRLSKLFAGARKKGSTGSLY